MHMCTLHNIHGNYYFHRNSNMKVEVVMKYLVDKLGLARPHQVHLIGIYYSINSQIFVTFNF
jgi:hypothetical protein